MHGMAVDHRVNLAMNFEGKQHDITPFLWAHEQAELGPMSAAVKGGMDAKDAYELAHDKVANPAEAAVRNSYAITHGLDVDKFNEAYWSHINTQKEIASQTSGQGKHPDAHTTIYGLDPPEKTPEEEDQMIHQYEDDFSPKLINDPSTIPHPKMMNPSEQKAIEDAEVSKRRQEYEAKLGGYDQRHARVNEILNNKRLSNPDKMDQILGQNLNEDSFGGDFTNKDTLTKKEEPPESLKEFHNKVHDVLDKYLVDPDAAVDQEHRPEGLSDDEAIEQLQQLYREHYENVPMY